jgi:hypothetical protein
MTEFELRDQIISHLSRYFHTDREVKSICKTGRVDIGLVHKTDITKTYPIGIEVKRFDDKRGRDVGDWLKQAQRYSSLIWSLGKMLIIVAPQISGLVFDEGKLTSHNHMVNGWPHPHHNVSTFLGQFGVGEFQRYLWHDYKLNKDTKLSRIVFKGLVIWDQNEDVFYRNHYDRLCR